MDLSIIIVNWKSAEFTRCCLYTIYEHLASIEIEIVVVDNASWDPCGEMIRKSFPDVKFIQSEKNLGFAGANNLGASYCSGRNFLFLNPDTEIHGAALRAMSDVLDGTEGAGIAGPRLLNSDGSVQTSCIQRFPTVLNLTMDCEALRTAFPSWSLWGTAPLFLDSVMPTAVEVIAGACLMIRRNVFWACGGFNTKYFMYGEDADLCFQAKQIGWKSYYVPTALVTHHGGRSSSEQNESQFAAVVMRESLLTYMRLRHGRGPALAYRASIAVMAGVRISVLVILMAIGRAQRTAKFHASAKKWLRLLRWTLGLEPWATELSAASSKLTHEL